MRGERELCVPISAFLEVFIVTETTSLDNLENLVQSHTHVTMQQHSPIRCVFLPQARS